MKEKVYTFVANWKMNCSYRAACTLAQTFRDQSSMLSTERSQIIICPSFDALASCAQIVAKSPINIGAQTVSSHDFGPYTGQVSAQSLAELGCTYAIIGHSERRQDCHETNQEVADQAKELIAENITPIICIGETENEYKAGVGAAVLETQLEPIIAILQSSSSAHPIIAYEPVFAIGTGIIPEPEYLTTMITGIKTYLALNLPDREYTLIYGGSVSEETVPTLRSIEGIQGFLIGSASLDFQKFQKIVSLWYTKQ